MSPPATTRDASARPLRCRWTRYGSVSLLLVLALVLIQQSLVWWGNWQAQRCYDQRAVSQCLDWIHWTRRFSFRSGNADTLEAGCYRWLQDPVLFAAALEQARQNGASTDLLQKEWILGQVSAGHFPLDVEILIEKLLETGTPLDEVFYAVTSGLLLQDRPDHARRILQKWSATDGGEAATGFAAALLEHGTGNHRDAIVALQATLQRQPRHLPARRLLAETHEAIDEHAEAGQQYAIWMQQLPSDMPARVGFSRSLRRQGQIEQAAQVMSRLRPGDLTQAGVKEELGELAFQTGDFAAAVDHFTAAWNHHPLTPTSMVSLATSLSLLGKHNLSNELFGQWDQRQRTSDAGPAGKELADRFLPRLARIGQTPVEPPTTSDLFAEHCGNCHGNDGRGNGRAAKHLYPRPTNLVDRPMRFTATAEPLTPAAVRRVLLTGIPGTSMPSFGELDNDTVQRISEHVVEIHQAQDTLPAADPVAESALPPPAGEELLHRHGCVICHPLTAGQEPRHTHFDDANLPVLIRNLAIDPFKGGESSADIGKRITQGIPGTIHPQATNLTRQELDAMLETIQSQRVISGRIETNQQRLERAGQQTRQSGGN